MLESRRVVFVHAHPDDESISTGGTVALLGDRAFVLTCTMVGSAATVSQSLSTFIARHRPDELIVTAQIFDHAARVRSFEILSHISGSQPGDD